MRRATSWIRICSIGLEAKALAPTANSRMATRPPTPRLDRGQVSSDEPETDDRLDDRRRPDNKEHDDGRGLKSQGSRVDGDQGLCPQEASGGYHDRDDGCRVPDPRQRDQRTTKTQ